MGLSISRSIIQSHEGRLWASPADFWRDHFAVYDPHPSGGRQWLIPNYPGAERGLERFGSVAVIQFQRNV